MVSENLEQVKANIEAACKSRNAPSRKLGDRSIRCRRSPRGSRPNEGWLTSAAAAMANTPIAPSMKRKILSIVVTL